MGAFVKLKDPKWGLALCDATPRGDKVALEEDEDEEEEEDEDEDEEEEVERTRTRTRTRNKKQNGAVGRRSCTCNGYVTIMCGGQTWLVHSYKDMEICKKIMRDKKLNTYDAQVVFCLTLPPLTAPHLTWTYPLTAQSVTIFDGQFYTLNPDDFEAKIGSAPEPSILDVIEIDHPNRYTLSPEHDSCCGWCCCGWWPNTLNTKPETLNSKP